MAFTGGEGGAPDPPVALLFAALLKADDRT
jgi:hypothetical protein